MTAAISETPIVRFGERLIQLGKIKPADLDTFLPSLLPTHSLTHKWTVQRIWSSLWWTSPRVSGRHWWSRRRRTPPRLVWPSPPSPRPSSSLPFAVWAPFPSAALCRLCLAGRLESTGRALGGHLRAVGHLHSARYQRAVPGT